MFHHAIHDTFPGGSYGIRPASKSPATQGDRESCSQDAQAGGMEVNIHVPTRILTEG